MSRRLHPHQGSGEADIGSVTDEIDEAQPQDATAEPGVPPAIAQLGVEARAEFIRARQRLGLGDAPTEPLGIVGRYRLDAELGRGGMGIVFRASDPELDRPVAIKLVQSVPFARYDKLRTRLLREAKVLAKLAHPNVVRVYDCGQHEGEVYLAMELVEGATLRDWQRGQSPRSILDAYQQAARGLAAAHDLGITHRDFKPDNALVASDGRVLVGDFGLAGVPAGDELRTEGSSNDATPSEATPREHVSATRTGALLGTPTYMAPEQLRGEVATPRSDQFAFCVSLWEALTGARPFAGEQREALLEQIEQRRVQGAERLPRRLRTRLMRGLAVEPEARFDHLRELADGLVPRRGRAVLAVGVAASLVVGVGVGRWLSEEPVPCELPVLLDHVARMPEWERVREQLENASLVPSYDRLVGLFEGMRSEAEVLCRPTDDEGIARQEWLRMRIHRLESTLESNALQDPALLQEAIEYIESERWSAPPPRSLDKEVVGQLQHSYSLRMNNALQGALDMADLALKASDDDQHVELALVHRWRGRVLALQGRHDEAMNAYGEAIIQAEIASYADARLETELLAAKTAVMRLGDLDRARDSLNRAYGLLDRLCEPWLSPRWADYHEVLAAILKRDALLDVALKHQWYALLIRSWWGGVFNIGTGYANLGTIHEWRARDSDFELARINYERAFETLQPVSSSPEWLEAAFNLGHWLVQNGNEAEWQRAELLLQKVRAKSNDARLSALTELVMLSIYKDDAKEARALAQELEVALRDTSPSKPSVSEERRLDAWQNVTAAYALAEEPAAFEGARAAFGCVVQEAVARGSTAQIDDVQQQTALLDLTAAFDLKEAAPERALALANSVRDYLTPLPSEKRPLDMLEAVEKLITELRTSTPPATHP